MKKSFLIIKTDYGYSHTVFVCENEIVAESMVSKLNENAGENVFYHYETYDIETNKDKVYIVISSENDSENTIGVYEDRKYAENKAKEMSNEYNSSVNEYYVEEFKLLS